MKETEIWKSLEFLGYPNYEVSTFGRVKSLNYRRSGKEKILKQAKTKKGYLQLTLNQNGKKKFFKVHRLTALAFIPNPLNLPQINHKDENKENNHVDNLEWCDNFYNIHYGSCQERKNKSLKELLKGNPISEEHKHKISKAQKGKPRLYKRKPILQYTKEGIFVREWDSAKSVSENLNIYATSITACCKNKLKSAYGFLWKYKE